MDLSTHTSLVGIAEAIAPVLEVCAVLGSEIYVTGAMARDLCLSFAHGIDTGRRTFDVDFAIECSDWRTFERIGAELTLRGSVRDRRVQHRFRYSNGTEIDLIPFGGVERTDRTIAWPPDENPVMNLVGFQEVSASARLIELPGEVTVPVVSLAALGVLKLLAWEDRRQTSARNKDAQDLAVISRNYHRVRVPKLSIESEAELLERNGFEDEAASAELLGLDMARFGSRDVRDAVHRILERELHREGPLELASMFRPHDPLFGLRVLFALRRGFGGAG
ncbi:MAG: nucleotidyl transferase AbiEii/AbiGii toxin family protein [Acidobacteria bacterium]|nr:nucleotidyl transferase AbiEii/AbiGii toxin family protein [Acidobacteriota bacterium]